MTTPERILQQPHPWLDVACLLTTFDAPLGELEVPASLRALFDLEADAPMGRSEPIRQAVRDLLRHTGFRPRGRNKPASEYLIKAIEKGWFSPTRGINLAVDACNAVSLHSGLPISVVDLDRVRGDALRIATCPQGTRYVFNPSGQEIDASHLIALWDEEGPCANAVKDAQRTKTSEETTRTLSVIWGTHALTGRTEHALEWYRALLERAGATTRLVSIVEAPGEE